MAFMMPIMAQLGAPATKQSEGGTPPEESGDFGAVLASLLSPGDSSQDESIAALLDREPPGTDNADETTDQAPAPTVAQTAIIMPVAVDPAAEAPAIDAEQSNTELATTEPATAELTNTESPDSEQLNIEQLNTEFPDIDLPTALTEELEEAESPAGDGAAPPDGDEVISTEPPDSDVPVEDSPPPPEVDDIPEVGDDPPADPAPDVDTSETDQPEVTSRPGLRLGQQDTMPGLRLGQQDTIPGLRLGQQVVEDQPIPQDGQEVVEEQPDPQVGKQVVEEQPVPQVGQQDAEEPPVPQVGQQDAEEPPVPQVGQQDADILPVDETPGNAPARDEENTERGLRVGRRAVAPQAGIPVGSRMLDPHPSVTVQGWIRPAVAGASRSAAATDNVVLPAEAPVVVPAAEVPDGFQDASDQGTESFEGLGRQVAGPQSGKSPETFDPAIPVRIEAGEPAKLAGAIRSMSVRGQREARLHLVPAQLGPRDVHIEVDAGKIVVTLTTESAAGRQALQSQLPELRLALEQAGFELDRLDLSQGGPTSTLDQPGQEEDGLQQRQNLGSQRRLEATAAVDAAEAMVLEHDGVVDYLV